MTNKVTLLHTVVIFDFVFLGDYFLEKILILNTDKYFLDTDTALVFFKLNTDTSVFQKHTEH